ncbi:hypothetical protein EP51_43390 (plasmid) [Rhodococcus opacus]|uniref:Acyl-CoA dehydrogenase n=1 Tax=Rhodococcus opacus TaxID=37919 RepID=A0A076F5K7_RHOOP|nr:hypothetical protein EP51_43390 [Rhodococcus opacus]
MSPQIAHVGSPRLRGLVSHIGRGAVERDREARAPFTEFALLKQARIGALRLPRDAGGGGATLPELFALVIDLGEADPNVAHSLRNHFQFLEGLIRRPHADNGPWIEHALAGRLFGQAATEVAHQKAGGFAEEFDTTTDRTDAGLRLNGTKYYSTGNLYADLIVVASRGPDGGPARLVVPSDRPGVIIERDWDGIGQRFTGSGTTRFVDVPVLDSDFLSVGTLFGDAPPYLATFPQLYLTAVITGILRRASRDAADLVRSKQRSFYHAAGDTPVEDPILQETVGYLSSQAYVAEAAVLTAAAALEEATNAHGTEKEYSLAVEAALKAAKAKVVIDEQAMRATAEFLFDVGGGTAVRQSAHLDRHWRNIRTIASHNPRTYKAKAIGNYDINGTALPNAGYF